MRSCGRPTGPPTRKKIPSRNADQDRDRDKFETIAVGYETSEFVIVQPGWPDDPNLSTTRPRLDEARRVGPLFDVEK